MAEQAGQPTPYPELNPDPTTNAESTGSAGNTMAETAKNSKVRAKHPESAGADSCPESSCLASGKRKLANNCHYQSSNIHSYNLLTCLRTNRPVLCGIL